MALNNCNCIHLADVGNAHVTLARHLRVQGAFRKVLLVGQATTTLVMMTLTLFKGSESPPFQPFFFPRKKIDVQVLVSVFGFLTYGNADPGTWTFCENKLSMTTIRLIKNIKFVTFRVSE